MTRTCFKFEGFASLEIFSTRIDGCLSSRWRDSQDVIERFRSVGQETAETSKSEVAVKVVIVGRPMKERSSGSFQLRAERRARCHNSTNGWPLHRWNAWRLLCAVYDDDIMSVHRRTRLRRVCKDTHVCAHPITSEEAMRPSVMRFFTLSNDFWNLFD